MASSGSGAPATTTPGEVTTTNGQSSRTIQQGVAANSDSPLGTNVGAVTDSSPVWPFVDAMKTSRPWISGTDGTWDDGRAIDVDSNGWVRSLQPGQVARTLMFWDLSHPYPTGKYTVLYEGKGTLAYSGGARLDAASSSPGRDVLDVGTGGIALVITSTDTSDPLRNIRVIMPGGVCSNDERRHCDASTSCDRGASCRDFETAYQDQVFHPDFLKSLEKYRVLRFMDWEQTNSADERTWETRPKAEDARYTVNGVPLTVMIDLANRLHADPWFNIPHVADDTYVTEFAKTIRDGLASDRKAYIEHSNEVWNGAFPQSSYLTERGLSSGLSDNPFEASLRYHSKRSIEIFKIFETTLGEASRLVRVMGAQASNTWTSTTELDFQDALQHTDAVAIAPYFGAELGGPDQANRIRGMSPDALMDEIEARWLPQAADWVASQAEAAKQRGVQLVAYEGGQHLVGVNGAENDATLNALLDAVNRSPRMKTFYESYLQSWRDKGGDLFVHYIDCGSYSKWGRWGALEFEGQPRADAPKFDALQTFIETTPAWW